MAAASVVQRTKTRWRARGAIGFAVTAAALTHAACVGDRLAPCEYRSDCAPGWACGGDGFCIRECTADSDCPCGAFCGTTCGLCLRNDGLGPGTCFAFQNGLGTDEVLGACRNDVRDGGRPSASAPDATDAVEASTASSMATDSGVCVGPVLTLPMCIASPPDEAGPSPEAAPADADDAGALADADDASAMSDGDDASAPSDGGDASALDGAGGADATDGSDTQ